MRYLHELVAFTKNYVVSTKYELYLFFIIKKEAIYMKTSHIQIIYK